jgi:hypothetical protein
MWMHKINEKRSSRSQIINKISEAIGPKLHAEIKKANDIALLVGQRNRSIL